MLGLSQHQFSSECFKNQKDGFMLIFGILNSIELKHITILQRITYHLRPISWFQNLYSNFSNYWILITSKITMLRKYENKN